MSGNRSMIGALFTGVLHLSPLARNFASLVGAQAIGRTIRFCYLVVIARLLGPEQVGLYAYCIALYLAILLFAGFGQGVILATRVHSLRSRTSGLASHSLTLRLAALGLGAAAALTVVWVREEDALVAYTVTAFLLALVARGFALWVREYCVALEDSVWIPRFELTFRGGEALLGTALLLTGAGLLTISYLHLIVWVLEATFSFRLLSRRSSIRVRPGLRRRLLIRIARMSLVLTLSYAFLHLFSHAAIVTLKTAQLDLAVVGQFGVAMQFFTTVMILPVAFGMALLPAVGRVQKKGEGVEIAQLATVVKLALVIGGIAAVLSYAYAPSVISAILGRRFEAAAGAFALLSWALGPCAVYYFAAQALNALNGRVQVAAIAGATIGVQVVLVIFLQPYGALSATILAVLLSSLIGCFTVLVFLRPRIGVSGHGWWLRPMFLVAATGLTMRLEIMPGVWSAPLFVGLLIGLSYLTKCFSRDEVEFVVSRLRRRG